LRNRTLLYFGILLVILLLTSPVFFDIDRIGAFNAVPHDDYADYVLYLAHQNPAPPESPYIYRIGSVAAAMPFYYTLPTYRFSNLGATSPGYVEATQAISVVSYLALLLTALVVIATVRERYGGSLATACLLGLASFFLAGYTSEVGIDPLACLLVSVLAYWIDTPVAFIPLVLVSAAFNEKLPIIFAALLLARLGVALLGKRRYEWYPQLAAACVAVAGYFVVRLAIFPVAGYENQTQPNTFVRGMLDTLAVSASAKGFVQNAIPVLIVAVLGYLALRAPRRGPFQAADLGAAVVMLAISLFADLGVTVGRVVMYTYPLYLPALTPLIDHAFGADAASRAARVPHVERPPA
jgi:hypothetical protein